MKQKDKIEARLDGFHAMERLSDGEEQTDDGGMHVIDHISLGARNMPDRVCPERRPEQDYVGDHVHPASARNDLMATGSEVMVRHDHLVGEGEGLGFQNDLHLKLSAVVRTTVCGKGEVLLKIACQTNRSKNKTMWNE